MKKTIAAVLAAVSISLAAGCAANLPAGYDKFTAAREKYETLSSGRVTMTDLTTGDEIMRFSFYFNVNDEMVFSYWGSWQGEEQQAYSDGAEFFYGEAVRNAGIIESGDGPTSITYTYDPEKLNSASMPGVQEDIQSFERLTTTLEIDQQGYPSSFTEDGSVVTAAGEVMDFNMRIDISDINDVYDVQNPVDEIYKKGEKPAENSESSGNSESSESSGN